MQYLAAENLSVVFPKETLFDEVSFKIYEGDRIGLIGDNGSGKSTLLKIIDQSIKPSTGRIRLTHGLIIARLSQDLESEIPGAKVGDHPFLDSLRNEMTELEHEMSTEDPATQEQLLVRYAKLQERWDAAGGYNYRAQLSQILAALGLPENMIDRDYDPLSGGEKMRVNLARCLLAQADLLLLDEPTNHLDFMGLEWLQKTLRQFKGAMVIVSHDRYFLDKVTNRIFSFDAKKFYRYRGNYSQAKAVRDERILSLERQEKNLSENIEIQEQVVQTLFSHRKMTAYHERQRLVEDMRERLQDLRSKIPAERKMSFSFVPPDPDSAREDRVLLETQDLTMAFDERVLFSDFTYVLRAKDRHALIGPNGCGKTTLLRILLGEEAASGGQLRLYGNPKISYMGQRVHFPQESTSLYEYLISEHPQRSETELRARLHQFGFPFATQDKRIEILSGGERHRLYLASIFEAKPDVLFMDEPTNHLDIYSREHLEDLLQEWPGALVLVSHDRFFIEALAHDVYGFVERKINRHETYEAWLRDFEANLNTQKPPQTKQSKPTSVKTQASGKKSPIEEYRTGSPAHRRKLRANWLKEVQDLEASIASLESAHENFEAGMTNHSPEAYEVYASSLVELEDCYNHYFALLEILDETK